MAFIERSEEEIDRLQGDLDTLSVENPHIYPGSNWLAGARAVLDWLQDSEMEYPIDEDDIP